MKNKEETLELLNLLASGEISVDEAFEKLKAAPFEELEYAKVDSHRAIRKGYQEVIYGEGKTVEQIFGIVSNMKSHGASNIIVTRLSSEAANLLKGKGIEMEYFEIARFAVCFPKEIERRGKLVVASAGTSDMPVAEEAALTAETLGSNVVRLYDVGVSGIHRLFPHMEEIMNARAIVVVAGMEGALASVIGGLADCPVVAVPTSVGYGASFGGVSALLGMLNSCASGLSVVNIDNGFGAGYLANMINLAKGIDD